MTIPCQPVIAALGGMKWRTVTGKENFVPESTVGELGEDPLVADVITRYPGADWLAVGPGDDAAVLDLPGRLVFCTDTLVEGLDFRRDWSTARDVGVKTAAQNFADVAAMGGRPKALLVSLTTPADLPAAWALGLADGLAQECTRAGAVVAGGDLSAGDQLVVTGTALGTLSTPDAVLRSGAAVGDVVAIAGVSGRSAAGWALLRHGFGALDHPAPGDGVSDGEASPDADLSSGDGPAAGSGLSSDGGLAPGGGLAVDGGLLSGGGVLAGAGVALSDGELAAVRALIGDHRRPQPPYEAGPAAALAGASAMIDTSDGLLRDAERLGRASGVTVDLDLAALRPDADLFLVAGLLAALPGVEQGDVDPVGWVLTGGEDHALLACFPPSAVLPQAFRAIGVVRPAEAAEAVLVDGKPVAGSHGWHHFS